jgi:predicted small metal-binding protein
MKEFRCGDVVPSCSEVFAYDTYEELLYQVVSHARHDHEAGDFFDALVSHLRSTLRAVRPG